MVTFFNQDLLDKYTAKLNYQQLTLEEAQRRLKEAELRLTLAYHEPVNRNLPNAKLEVKTHEASIEKLEFSIYQLEESIEAEWEKPQSFKDWLAEIAFGYLMAPLSIPFAAIFCLIWASFGALIGFVLGNAWSFEGSFMTGVWISWVLVLPIWLTGLASEVHFKYISDFAFGFLLNLTMAVIAPGFSAVGIMLQYRLIPFGENFVIVSSTIYGIYLLAWRILAEIARDKKVDHE